MIVKFKDGNDSVEFSRCNEELNIKFDSVTDMHFEMYLDSKDLTNIIEQLIRIKTEIEQETL